MKLRLQFGMTGPKIEINWWMGIKDFPTLVTLKGKKYEFVVYDEDLSRQVDYNCIFSEVQSYDPNFYVTTYVAIENYISDYGSRCECGALYTSFPQIHMFYCPKWTKV